MTALISRCFSSAGVLWWWSLLNVQSVAHMIWPVYAVATKLYLLNYIAVHDMLPALKSFTRYKHSAANTHTHEHTSTPFTWSLNYNYIDAMTQNVWIMCVYVRSFIDRAFEPEENRHKKNSRGKYLFESRRANIIPKYHCALDSAGLFHSRPYPFTVCNKSTTIYRAICSGEGDTGGSSIRMSWQKQKEGTAKAKRNDRIR